MVPVLLQSFTVKPYLGFNELNWYYSNSATVSLAEVEYSFDGIDFLTAGTVSNNGQLLQQFAHIVNGYTIIFYQLKMVSNGRTVYSNIISTAAGAVTAIRLYLTVITNGRLMLETTTPVEKICLFAADGKKVFEKPLGGFLDNIAISLPLLHLGMYIVQLFLKGNVKNYKLFAGY